MEQHAGPIYEVTLAVDPEAAEGLDEWLAQHVADMLTQPGFVDAEIASHDNPDGRTTRVVRYFVASDDALQRYFDDAAEAMRAETTARFGARVEASRRVLRNRVAASPDTDRETCLNCQAVLTGQYCGQCGQRAQSRLISTWELVRDAFGDILDADSRLWRTLVPLAVRPGQLTYDYLRGRRARFMPPFRTYLVLSLLFFAIAFFDPRENLGILFEPDVAEEGTGTLADADKPQASARARQEILDELAKEGIIAEPSPAGDGSPKIRIDLGGNEINENCDLSDYDPSELPEWLGRRLTRERVQHVCDRMTAEDGAGLRGFADKLLESVPVGLIILLPVMALVLKLLYPLSKRYYVEHLLLVVHFHAFIFLALIAQTVLARSLEAIGEGDSPASLLLIAIPIYIHVYLFKTLRRVYGQGRFVTSIKFLLLGATYLVGLTMLLMAMALIAAFSI